MMDFLAVYSEAGMIGVVGIMFVYLVISLSKKSEAQQEMLKNLEIENRGQSETIENMEGMVIKLISRWNKSDETRDRRWEGLKEETNELIGEIKEMKGSLSRINGKNGQRKSSIRKFNELWFITYYNKHSFTMCGSFNDNSLFRI